MGESDELQSETAGESKGTTAWDFVAKLWDWFLGASLRGKIAAVIGATLVLTGIAVTRDGIPERPFSWVSKIFARHKLNVYGVFATELTESWDLAIHKALERAQREGLIEYNYEDHVGAADIARKVRALAETGKYRLIVGDGFADEEGLRRVANDHRDLPFVFGSGKGPTEPNFSVFDNWIHEPAFVAGMIAGAVTQTNIVGVVGGKEVPEVNRLICAFQAGAREINASVRVDAIFVNHWYDPEGAQRVAQQLLDGGADFLYAERDGIIPLCLREQIPVIGNLTNKSEEAPEVVVTSVVWDMWPTIKHALTLIRSGAYTAEDYGNLSRTYKGGSRLEPFPPDKSKWWKLIPARTQAKIKERYDDIFGGQFRVPVIECSPKELRSSVREAAASMSSE